MRYALDMLRIALPDMCLYQPSMPELNRVATHFVQLNLLGGHHEGLSTPGWLGFPGLFLFASFEIEDLAATGTTQARTSVYHEVAGYQTTYLPT